MGVIGPGENGEKKLAGQPPNGNLLFIHSVRLTIATESLGGTFSEGCSFTLLYVGAFEQGLAVGGANERPQGR